MMMRLEDRRVSSISSSPASGTAYQQDLVEDNEVWEQPEDDDDDQLDHPV